MENETIKLDDIPSIFHPDEEEWEEISSWTTSIHDEGKCEEAIEILTDTEGGNYRATAHHLLAHMIEEHNFTLEDIAPVLESYHYYHTDQQRLADVYANESNRLANELKQELGDLPKSPGIKRCLQLLIFYGLNESKLRELWSYTWEEGRYKNRKDVAELLFRQAAFKEDFFDLIEDVLEDKFDWLAEENLEYLLQAFLFSETLSGIREKYLEKLISEKEAEAAKIIVRNTGHKEISVPQTKKIYKLLEEKGEKFASKAMALWLRNNFEEALPHLCELINRKHLNASFSHELQQAVKSTNPPQVFEKLAENVASTDENLPDFLASSHCRLLKYDEDVILSWLEDNWDRPELQKYSAGICVETLSEPGLNEIKREFMEIAEKIFDKFGSRRREDVYEENKLKGRKDDKGQRQKALSLVQEIKEASYDLDVDSFLETIKKYPSTFEAFGGKSLEDFVNRRDMIPCYAWVYEMDIQNRKSEFEKLLAEYEDTDESSPLGLHLELKRIAEAEEFRKIWEKRFDILLDSKNAIEERRVREDYTYWTELRFWAQLEPHFDVTVEPEKIPGLEDKKPDFLLNSPEGNLILEVTSLQKSPKELEERVKTSLGLRPQKGLKDKWKKQFKKCDEDPGLPIVIGIEVKSESQLMMDLPNSLYGPLSIRMTTDKLKGAIEEGTTRDLDRAFFGRDNIECISAVVGICPEIIPKEDLNGELFRPFYRPHNKINWRLWVKLRDALFGSDKEHLIERMMKIPTITTEEAESLVEHGIDDPGYLASKRVTFPGGLQIPHERFEDLQGWAENLVRYQSSNHVSILNSVNKEVVEKLADEEIRTVEDVIEAEQKPDNIEEKTWEELRKEACELLSCINTA